MQKQLTTAPFMIDAEKFAEGLLDLFTEDERVVLRFGMLPAEKMGVVERMLRNKFLEKATVKEGDLFTCYFDNGEYRTITEFSMKKLIGEAMREISLELYKIGDLVV